MYSVRVNNEDVETDTNSINVFLIDLELNKLLFKYTHRENPFISAVMMTEDKKWIISSDINGEIDFYRVRSTLSLPWLAARFQ